MPRCRECEYDNPVTGDRMVADQDDGMYVCMTVHPGDTVECFEMFDTCKGLVVHQITHDLGPCGRCGELKARNGLTQHEQFCRERPDWLNPGIYQARLDDFMAHVQHVPSEEGAVLAVWPDKARFVRSGGVSDIAGTVSSEGCPVWLIPVAILDAPMRAKRWRRIEPGAPPPAHDRPARPRTGSRFGQTLPGFA